MASIEPRKNKDGIITSYTIRVFRGKDENGKNLKPFIRSFPDKTKGESIPKNWSQDKIKKEVQKIATLFEEECRQGKVAVRSVKFSTFAKEYLEMMYQTGNLKTSTLDSYNNYLERINDVNLNGIGHLELDKISTPILNKFYLTLATEAKSNNRKGKPLSPKTIKNYHGFISSVMTYACKQNIINTNPCQYATIPTKNENADEKEVIEDKDIQNVIIAINSLDIKWRIFFLIAFSTGARLGEIIGIQYADIDFEQNKIHLHNNVQYRRDYVTKEYRIYIDSLKTRQARNVIIPDVVSTLIKDYAKEQKIINLNSPMWLFPCSTNPELPMYPSGAKRQADNFENHLCVIKKQHKVSYYDKVEKVTKDITLKVDDVVWYNGYSDDTEINYKVAMGSRQHPTYIEIPVTDVETLPHINPHKFRHTFASVLNYNNLDIVTISKSLGHTQVSTTTDVYSHLFNKQDSRPAEIFGNLLANN